jgi:phytoene dehydrogenase-like protein
MPTPSFDAIIIGGGVNGLACAGRLAQAGQKVLVLDAADTPGGGALTAEFAPGYRVDGLAHLVTHLDTRMLAALKPERHGLDWAVDAMATTALSSDGGHLTLNGAYGESVQGLDEAEAQRWAALRGRLCAIPRSCGPCARSRPRCPARAAARATCWRWAAPG